MKQQTLGFNLLTKKTRKREFLEQMNKVVPWDVLVQVPDHHGAAIDLFRNWAESGGRVFGRLADSVCLSNGSSFAPNDGNRACCRPLLA